MIFCTRPKSKLAMKTRPAGWRPLVLRWRRRDLRSISKADRVTSPVSFSYFPQVHLHFTTFVNKLDQRLNVQTSVNRRRVLSQSYCVTQMNTNFAPRHINRNLSKHNTFFYASKPGAPIPKQIQQPRPSVSLKSVSPLLFHTRHAELVNVFKTQSLIREHRSQILSFRSTSRETVLKPAPRIYLDRGEELVWRRTPRRTTINEDAPLANSTETTYQQTVRTPTIETYVQSTPPANTQTTPQQLPKLDPALLDRLTDDVIRRVEKRALIERQRRGL